jgi:hypothetical protein
MLFLGAIDLDSSYRLLRVSPKPCRQIIDEAFGLLEIVPPARVNHYAQMT